MDKLTLNSFDLWMRVGCTPEEQAFPQRLEISVIMEGDFQKAGHGDDIAHSVDYAQVLGDLQRELSPQSFKLVETVAEKIAQRVLQQSLIQRVTVQLKKRALPGLESFEVEITRSVS